MATYLDILAVQGPTSIGNDKDGQPMRSFNVRATGADSSSPAAWESDLATLIHAAGLGTLYTDVFIGSSADIPIGIVAVEIINTGGAMTVFTAEDAQYPKLSAQILVRAPIDRVADGTARAMAIYALLNGKRNITI